MTAASPDHSLAVRELMSVSTINVAPCTRVRDALLLMERYGVRHLPVVEADKVVGMLSKTDIREALGLGDDQLVVHDRLDWAVSRIMSDGVWAVHRTTPVCDAIDLLIRHQVGALPVLDQHTQKLVGILSTVDVLRASRSYFK